MPRKLNMKQSMSVTMHTRSANKAVYQFRVFVQRVNAFLPKWFRIFFKWKRFIDLYTQMLEHLECVLLMFFCSSVRRFASLFSAPEKCALALGNSICNMFVAIFVVMRLIYAAVYLCSVSILKLFLFIFDSLIFFFSLAILIYFGASRYQQQHVRFLSFELSWTRN